MDRSRSTSLPLAPLKALGQDAARIAERLFELARSPTQGQEPTSEDVRAILRTRRLRSGFFGEDLFADPAWDMLLTSLPRNSRARM